MHYHYKFEPLEVPFIVKFWDMFQFIHVQLSIAASNTPFNDYAISEKAEAFIEFRLPDTVGAKNVTSIKLEAL